MSNLRIVDDKKGATSTSLVKNCTFSGTVSGNLDGERGSAGGLLATVYTSAQQLEAGLEIAELDDAIEQLDTLLARPGIGMGGVSDIDADVYKRQD